ncbi:hypothetical protein H4582DRAFT_2076414 [Lactarius indigo]|nr:hypothetical protein H4582DRAFT_2076414 [Lactarius indigo]
MTNVGAWEIPRDRHKSSQTMQTSSSSTPKDPNLQPIFEKALKDYKKKTGTDLTTHPLAIELNGCDSPESILTVLERKANELNQSRSSDDRLTKWLKPTVNILNALSAPLGEGAGLAFTPTKIIFSGIGIFLLAAKTTVTSRDALVELFDRIESFFRLLKAYTEDSPTQTVVGVLVKIMAEVLSILAIATNGVKQKRTKTILKKLAGTNDIEDALQRFRKLEQGELLVMIAQVSRETKGDTKQTNGAAEEIVKRMDVSNSSPSLDVVASTCQSSKIVTKEECMSPGNPPTPALERSCLGVGPGSEHTREKSVGGPAGPVIEMLMWPPSGPPPDRAQAPGSWPTWQLQPDLEYALPPSEPTIHLGPRSPPSSIAALSLEEPPAPVHEPPGVDTWQSVQFGPTLEKTEAHPAWATWQGKLQAGREYTSPEGPPRLFKPRSPHSSIEALPTPFRPSTRRPVHQRRVFRRARKKPEVNSSAESLYCLDYSSTPWVPWQHPTESRDGDSPEPLLESLTVTPESEEVIEAHAQSYVQEGDSQGKFQFCLENSPPSSVYASIKKGLPRPQPPRSFIEGPPAPVHRQRIFRRPRKTLEAHPPGGVVETPMYTPPVQPPGRVRRRAVPSE